jgi:hypothetical protein
MNGFFQYVFSKLFAQRVGGCQVYVTLQDAAQFPAQPDELEKSNTGIGLIFNQDVDIAFFLGLAAGNRPEEIEVFDREPAHQLTIAPQQGYGPISIHIKVLAQPTGTFKACTMMPMAVGRSWQVW